MEGSLDMISVAWTENLHDLSWPDWTMLNIIYETRVTSSLVEVVKLDEEGSALLSSER